MKESTILCIRTMAEADGATRARIKAAIAVLEGKGKLPASSPNESLLVHQAEAARMLSTSRWSIRRLEREGRLPSVLIRSGLKRYRREDVLALAKGGTDL